MTARTPIKPASELGWADRAGWIAWAGGENPLPSGARVVVRLRDGSSFPTGPVRKKGLAAAFMIWTHNGRHPSGTDIVAFRVIAIDEPVGLRAAALAAVETPMMEEACG